LSLLPGGFSLLSGRPRLPYCRVDQKECAEAAEDRVDEAGVGIGDYAFVIRLRARIPEQSQQKQNTNAEATTHWSLVVAVWSEPARRAGLPR